MSALTEQVGGSHYKDCKIQPIQYIEANKLSFLEACVVKRVTRHDKPTGKGRQDIEKAIHELQLLLELRYGFNEERMDVIGQNGNDGEHYAQGPEETKWAKWDFPNEYRVKPVGSSVRVVVKYKDGEIAGPGKAVDFQWREIVAYRLA